jgi:hypothetical protein
VALARHHQVVVLCPWPPDLPPPGRTARADRKTGEFLRAETQRMHVAYHQLRRRFARLGVPVLCAQSGEPARLILERLGQLRTAGRRR